MSLRPGTRVHRDGAPDIVGTVQANGPGIDGMVHVSFPGGLAVEAASGLVESVSTGSYIVQKKTGAGEWVRITPGLPPAEAERYRAECEARDGCAPLRFSRYMTRAEYQAKPDDYRDRYNGQASLLSHDPRSGATVLMGAEFSS